MKKIKSYSTQNENHVREQFYDLYKNSPIPPNEKLQNLGLYLNRQTLSRILFMHEIYQEILDVHGVVIEFGVRWGQNLALYESFRGMYEPYNYTRKIIGFDTFEGFPTVDKLDGNQHRVGDYSVTEGYEHYLEKVLDYHELESPINHIRKYELVKGDVVKTLPTYLNDHPETLIALAYFDFDLYTPTKSALEAILPYLTKGSIIAFDELNHPLFPGETIAYREVLGKYNLKVKRSTLSPYMSYVKVGE